MCPCTRCRSPGLIIALGLLIDNAIVMVDEIRKHLDRGRETGQAVSAAVRHLFVPLLGSTLTTVLAFMPIVLMPGGAGEFVGSIGISVILALLSSFFLSLTIIPALTGLVNQHFPKLSRADSWVARGIRTPELAQRYRSGLTWLFARPVLGVGLAILLPISGFYAAGQLKEQFFPPADRDQFQLQLRLPRGSSMQATLDYAQRARRVMLPTRQHRSGPLLRRQQRPDLLLQHAHGG